MEVAEALPVKGEEGMRVVESVLLFSRRSLVIIIRKVPKVTFMLQAADW